MRERASFHSVSSFHLYCYPSTHAYKHANANLNCDGAVGRRHRVPSQSRGTESWPSKAEPAEFKSIFSHQGEQQMWHNRTKAVLGYY
jgi:hypothetical protein